MDSRARAPIFFWSKSKLATHGFVTLLVIAIMVWLTTTGSNALDSNRQVIVYAVGLVGVSQACLFFGLALGRRFALAAQLAVAIAAAVGLALAGAWFLLPLGWAAFTAAEAAWMIKLRSRETAA